MQITFFYCNRDYPVCCVLILLVFPSLPLPKFYSANSNTSGWWNCSFYQFCWTNILINNSCKYRIFYLLTYRLCFLYFSISEILQNPYLASLCNLKRFLANSPIWVSPSICVRVFILKQIFRNVCTWLLNACQHFILLGFLGMTGTICQKSPGTTVTPPILDFLINLAMCGPKLHILP